VTAQLAQRMDGFEARLGAIDERLNSAD
jgi:hypothetical protein